MKTIRKYIPLVLFSFLVIEIMLRVLGAWYISPEHLTHGLPYFVDLKKGIIELREHNVRPLASHYPYQTKLVPLATGGIAEARINNLGFRGKDFTATKPYNSLRIGTLGASSTFGFGVRDEDSYPQQLENYLNEHCSKYSQVEVYNFGAPYQDSSTIKRVFSDIAANYNLDLVTFYEGANDTGAVQVSGVWEIFEKLSSRLLLLEYIKIPIRD